jgi:hypothetical protein
LKRQFLFRFKRTLLFTGLFFLCGKLMAHPMPGSTVALSVWQTSISGQARIPLIELANAVGEKQAAKISDPFFISYFTNHIQAATGEGKWKTTIEAIEVISSNDPVIGSFQKVVVHFTITPPDIRWLRNFTFNYDAVIHQVVTHSALVYIKQDWKNGIHDESNAEQVGIIGTDIRSGKIFPLQVNLQDGSSWKGFQSMVSLGMQHIKEGTDHILFLLTLILPAMLVSDGNRWKNFGGLRYSLTRLLKIVTAFTAGHSLTLLTGALGWLHLPSQPVEILIGVSILVSAVHAIRPVFPGKEAFVACSFGLIHGLAFATVLSALQLNGSQLLLSVFGFNTGIEMMQIFIIAIIVPWLILLSKTPAYRWFRPLGAAMAGVMAIAWIAQRVTGINNLITDSIGGMSIYAGYTIGILMLFSTVNYIATIARRKSIPTQPVQVYSMHYRRWTGN